jgi:hypothetical protein
VDRREGALRVAAGLVIVYVAVFGCTRSGDDGGHSAAADPTPTPSRQLTVPPQASGSVAVYPLAGSRTAMPATQVSLRGIAADHIGAVTVTGSVSGRYAGTIKADSDGEGASFYPTNRFAAGEQVTVTTSLHLVGGSGTNNGTIHFTVCRPIAESLDGPTEKSNADEVQHFVSAPSLQPPKYTVQKNDLASDVGDILLAPKNGSGGDGPMITTPSGRLVWFRPLSGGLRAYVLRVQSYRGKPVLTWWQGLGTHDGHGGGTDYIYDTSYHRVASVRAGNGLLADMHDFTISPNNTALLTSYKAMHWNLTSIGGPKDGQIVDSIFQEIDIPTGNVLAEWHALDHVPVTNTVAAYSSAVPFDYFHINAVTSNGNGQVLVSGRSVSAVFDVDEASGKVIWQLGGTHGDDFTGSGTAFQVQHDVRWVSPTEISMFDNNHSGDSATRHSSAKFIKLSLTAHTATLLHSYTDPSIPWANTQGGTQLLANGHVFVGWGSQPYVTEFTAAGTLIYRARLSGANSSFQAFRSNWTATPTTSPAVVGKRTTTGTTVYVSWNGATRVASWRVLGGPDASSLQAVVTRKVNGFETSIAVTGSPADVQVQALSGSGAVLGTSSAVAVTS